MRSSTIDTPSSAGATAVGCGLFTRRGHDWTDRLRRVAGALRSLAAVSVTLDGEAVICDPNVIADFDRLRAAMARRSPAEAFLYAFDLLEIGSPWEDRREALARILGAVGPGKHMDGEHGPVMFPHACAMGLEGVVSDVADIMIANGSASSSRSGEEESRKNLISRPTRRSQLSSRLLGCCGRVTDEIATASLDPEAIIRADGKAEGNGRKLDDGSDRTRPALRPLGKERLLGK